MNEELHDFLKDLFILLQGKYDESLAAESTSAPEMAFRRGATFAYYDVLDLIRSQVKAFGYEDEASGFVVPELGKPAPGAA